VTDSTSSSSPEKRKHKRIQYGRMVNVTTATGTNLRLEVLDYSMGGLGLVSNSALSTGDVLKFESIMTLDGEVRSLDLTGEVCHIQEQFQEYSFGVRFL